MWNDKAIIILTFHHPKPVMSNFTEFDIYSYVWLFKTSRQLNILAIISHLTQNYYLSKCDELEVSIKLQKKEEQSQLPCCVTTTGTLAPGKAPSGFREATEGECTQAERIIFQNKFTVEIRRNVSIIQLSFLESNIII